jgi:hypothetical protein
MPIELDPVPHQAQIVDPSGRPSHIFSAWLEKVRLRIREATASLASVTGVLPVANGGTNSSTALNNNRIMRSASGAIVEASAINASRALVSDANGIPTHTAVTTTELGYVSGVTSAIQTQIDAKASTVSLNNHMADTTTHGTTGDIVGTSDTQTLTNKTIDADSNTISNIDNADIKAGAAIDRSKIATGTNNHVLINSGAGAMSSEAQLAVSRGGTNSGAALNNNRVMVSSGGAIVEATVINASRALVSDANGIPTDSAATAAEVGYLSGVTSGIQSQLNTKLGNTLADGKVFIGSVGNAATAQSVTGDIAITNAGVTSYSGTVPIAKGGTGATAKATAFDALSPMTTSGDIVYGGASGTGTRLGKGSDGQVLTLASGLPSWATPAASVASLVVTGTKTGAYTAASSDDVIPCDATSAGFTVTLPTAVGVSGKVYQIKRTDQTLANAVTIATTSSQTIDGATTRKLMTQYEEFTVVSDGSNWQVRSHTYPQGCTTYTPTVTYNTGGGTNVTHTGRWRRKGDSVEIDIASTFSNTSAAFSRPIYALPSGLTIDTAKLPSSHTTKNLGEVGIDDSGANAYIGRVGYLSTTTVFVWAVNAGTATASFVDISNTAPFTFNNADTINAKFCVPITNWEP